MGEEEQLLLKRAEKELSSESKGATTGHQERFEKLYNCELESLDYDSKVLGGLVSMLGTSYVSRLGQGAMKWVVCMLVGVLTAVIAFSVNLGVENIAGLKFWWAFKVVKSGSFVGAFILLATINCILAGLASCIVVYYGPGAAGSGIPDVKAFLNGVDLPNILSPQILIAKILGSIGAVSASLAVGKEGPFVHIGACLAYLLTQGEKIHPRLKGKFFNMFSGDRQLRDFVTCGAAAGVAAAFRAPVGGVLFALEEVTSWWRNQILWLAFFTTAVVSVVLRSMVHHCHVANCGWFGAGKFILFSADEGQNSYETFELLPMLLLGVMGGLLGSAFNALNAQLTVWRLSFFQRRSKRAQVVEAVCIALLTSTIAFSMSYMTPCQDCKKELSGACSTQGNAFSGSHVNFHCDTKEQHNDMALLFFNTQDDAIRNLLSSNNNDEYSVTTLLSYFTCFFMLATLTYGVSIPSGLFVPCILCGASYGRLVGMFVTKMHPNHRIDEGTYALLGAAGFLGGASRMTVSLCVILLELTNNMALLPLIMLVLLVAKGVGDGSGIRAIYEMHVDLKGVPFLPAQPERFMQHITAKEVSSEPCFLRRYEPIQQLKDMLGRNAHNGYPVVEDKGKPSSKLLGLVLRSNLEKVLRTHERRNADIFDGHNLSSSLIDAGSSPDAKDVIDLLPMVDPSHYVVDEDMPANKVYNLFRQLGLRHILVVPRAPQTIGMITRKDLLPGVLEQLPSTAATASFQIQVEGETLSTRRRKNQEGEPPSKGD